MKYISHIEPQKRISYQNCGGKKKVYFKATIIVPNERNMGASFLKVNQHISGQDNC